jgi:hypothetical protein
MARGARAAGVGHVVWSTLEDTRTWAEPGTTMPVLGGRWNVPHFDAKGEANGAFIDLGLPLTLLYTSFCWDNLVDFGMAPRRGSDGVLEFVLPMPEASLPGIAGEHLTGAQMAEQLALALGEPVRHVALTPRQYAALGFPGADDLANMFQFKTEFERAYRAARPVACARELYPGLQTFAGWLGRHRLRLPVERRVS